MLRCFSRLSRKKQR